MAFSTTDAMPRGTCVVGPECADKSCDRACGRGSVRLSLVVIAILHLALGLAIWFAPSIDATIPSSTISAEQGAAYTAPIPPATRFPYSLPSDTSAAPKSSRLLLFEDGKALGPAHVVHADIRVSAGGRYSHWNDAIYFSASDGSDPRTNGRTYSYTSPTRLHPAILLPSLIILALADACLLIVCRRALISFVHVHGAIRCTAHDGAGLRRRVGPGGSRGIRSIDAGGPRTAKGGTFILALIAHACLGLAVSIGMWIAASGLMLLILRKRDASLCLILLPAFPLSLVMFAILSAIALLLPAWENDRSVVVARLPAAIAPMASSPTGTDPSRDRTARDRAVCDAVRLLAGPALARSDREALRVPVRGYGFLRDQHVVAGSSALSVRGSRLCELGIAGLFQYAVFRVWRGSDRASRALIRFSTSGRRRHCVHPVTAVFLYLYVIDRAKPPDPYGVAVLLFAFSLRCATPIGSPRAPRSSTSRHW